MNNYFMMILVFMNNLETTLHMLKPLLLLMLRYFDYNMYTLYSREKIILFRKHLNDCICSSYNEEQKPIGIVIPKNRLFIGYISERVNLMYVFGKRKHLRQIVENSQKKPKIEKIIWKEEENTNEEKMIEYWYRTGDYSYFDYNKHKMFINDNPMTNQQSIIYSNIMKIYNEKNNVKCYLHGNSGTGKTFLCYMMARELKCYLCDSFNPCDPSDSFSNMYNVINPSPKKPLVLLLDEVDILLNKIHKQDIIMHKNSPIQVYNKTTWNNMIDKIDYGLYPNVILIMCSNLSERDIQQLDNSYLRHGRIDLIQHLIKE